MRDEDCGRPQRIGEDPTESIHQVFACTHIEASRRLIENQQLRIRHEGTGNLDPLALPLAQGCEGATGQRLDTQRREQCMRACLVPEVITLPPTAGDRPRRREHHVGSHLIGRNLLGEGGTGYPDTRAQFGQVDSTKLLTQDIGLTGGRVHACRTDLDQCRLPRTVGAEHDPALARGDRPMQVAKDDVLASAKIDPLEIDHLTSHGLNIPTSRLALVPQHLQGMRDLQGMRATFDFASHSTLFLHQRISGDLLLATTRVRQVLDGERGVGLLDYLAWLRGERVQEVRFIPLVPGDQQGLSGVSGHGSVALATPDQVLAISGATAVRLPAAIVTPWQSPFPSLSEAHRALLQSLESVTLALAEDRHLIVADQRIPGWELPAGFTSTARSLAATASTVLGLAQMLRSSAVIRERGSLEIFSLLADLERAARGALVLVIDHRMIEGHTTH